MIPKQDKYFISETTLFHPRVHHIDGLVGDTWHWVYMFDSLNAAKHVIEISIPKERAAKDTESLRQYSEFRVRPRGVAMDRHQSLETKIESLGCFKSALERYIT